MKEEELVRDGKRTDGRGLDEIREMEAKIGVVKNAYGSGLFRFGNTIAIASVYGPSEAYKPFERPDKAFLICDYKMLPFSTQERTKLRSRRSEEISMVITRAFENVLFLEEMPRTKIRVSIQIINAEASTRCAAINACSLAFADASIPMKDLLCSISVGKINGKIALDIAGKEDSYGECDMAIAYLPVNDSIYLLQADGDLSREEFKEALSLGINGCLKVYEVMKKCLIEGNEYVGPRV